MSVKISWHPQEFLSNLNFETEVAIEEIGQTVEEKAKEEVPVKTGALQRSIKHDNDMQITYKETEVSANTDYAIHVEYGTRRQQANPFMRRTLFGSIESIISIVSDAVRRATKD